MRTPTPPPGMAPDDEARFLESVRNARNIALRRREAAKRLQAPPGPAQAVRATWAPLRDAILDRRTAGGGPRAAD